MVKLIGSKKIKTAVFISGTGSNLKNLIQFSFLNNSPIKIDLVVSSNKKAKGLNYADKYKIKKNKQPFKKKVIDKKFCEKNRGKIQIAIRIKLKIFGSFLKL